MITPYPPVSEPVTMIENAVVSLVASALMIASLRAVTRTEPAAVTSESMISASTCAGCALFIASAMRPSPMIASTVLNRMFCVFQPIELNASTMPTVVPADSATLAVVASIWATFWASTTTSPLPPSSVVVVTVDRSITARAEESTTFVAMVPPTAMESLSSFSSNELPPDEMVVASAVARRNACSSARTVTAPASTVESLIVAAVVARNSLRTTNPPTA